MFKVFNCSRAAILSSTTFSVLSTSSSLTTSAALVTSFLLTSSPPISPIESSTILSPSTTSSSSILNDISSTNYSLNISLISFNSLIFDSKNNNILASATSDLSPCLANCSNQGICLLNSDQKFICQCNLYKTGSTCQKDTRPCISSPCLNFGICNDVKNGSSFQCTCQSDLYYGVFCENKIDLCKNSSICFNNQGYCIMNKSQAVCKCKTGYSGVNCEIISTNLAFRKSIISVTTIITIIILVFFILLIIFFDFTKYFLNNNNKKRIKKNKKITKFYYYSQKNKSDLP